MKNQKAEIEADQLREIAADLSEVRIIYDIFAGRLKQTAPELSEAFTASDLKLARVLEQLRSAAGNDLPEAI